MGALDKYFLLRFFEEKAGWQVADEEKSLVCPPDSFWDSMKGRNFHVYRAKEVFDMLSFDDTDVDTVIEEDLSWLK